MQMSKEDAISVLVNDQKEKLDVDKAKKNLNSPANRGKLINNIGKMELDENEKSLMKGFAGNLIKSIVGSYGGLNNDVNSISKEITNNKIAFDETGIYSADNYKNFAPEGLQLISATALLLGTQSLDKVCDFLSDPSKLSSINKGEEVFVENNDDQITLTDNQVDDIPIPNNESLEESNNNQDTADFEAAREEYEASVNKVETTEESTESIEDKIITLENKNDDLKDELTQLTENRDNGITVEQVKIDDLQRRIETNDKEIFKLSHEKGEIITSKSNETVTNSGSNENTHSQVTDQQIESLENAKVKFGTDEINDNNSPQQELEITTQDNNNAVEIENQAKQSGEIINNTQSQIEKQNSSSKLSKIVSPNRLNPEIDMEKEMENESFREEMGDFVFTVGKEFDKLIDQNQEGLKDALSSTSYMTINRESLYIKNEDGTLELTKTGETVREFMKEGIGIISDATSKMTTDLRKKGYNNEKVLISLDDVSSQLREIEQALGDKADVALSFAESGGEDIDQKAYSNEKSKDTIQEGTNTVRYYSLETQKESSEKNYINTLTSSITSPDDIASLYDEVTSNFNKYVLDGEIIYTKDPLNEDYINGDQVDENKSEIVKNELHKGEGEIQGFSLSDLLIKIGKDIPSMHSLHRKEINNGSEEDHEELFKHMAGKESSFDDIKDWKVLRRNGDTFKGGDGLEKNLKDAERKRKKGRLNNDDIKNIDEISKKLQETTQGIVMKNGVYHKNINSDYTLDYYKVTYENEGTYKGEELFIHKDDMQAVFDYGIDFRKDNTHAERREDIALSVNPEELFYQQLGITSKFLKDEKISYKGSNGSIHTLELDSGHTLSISVEDNGESGKISYYLGGEKFKGEATLYGGNIAQGVKKIAFLDEACQKLGRRFNRNKNMDQISDTFSIISKHTSDIISKTGELSLKDDKLYIDDKEYTQVIGKKA